MRCLHLSDLHVGKPNASQSSALATLVNAIAEANAGTRVDCIFLCGDIAFSGNVSEYTSFGQQVLEPLKALPGFERAQIVAVPGNHDIDCNQVDPVQWMGIGAERRASYFSEDAVGARVRAPRAKGFEPYATFARKSDILSPNPADEVSTHRIIETPAQRVQVICTNTAFFSDKDPSITEYELLPAPTASVRHRLLQAEDCDLRIVLGHHPIGWFRHEDREPFKSLLVENRAIYLHGHEHEIQARLGLAGLLSLGFGAAYQDKLDPENKNWARNSFAILEIEDALHVAFTEWDPKNGRWTPCTTVPSEFQTKSEILATGYRLPLAQSHGPTRGGTAKNVPATPRRIYAADPLSLEEWRYLLAYGRLVDQRDIARESFDLVPGESPLTLAYRTTSGQHLVKCIQSRSDSISRTQVESWNTLIDYQGLQSLTVVTFGSITDDARTSYLRLSHKKPLRILLAEEVALALSRVLPPAQVDKLASYDSRAVTASLLIRNGLNVVVQDKNEHWFEIIGPDGRIAESANVVVRDMRSLDAQFQRSSYLKDNEVINPSDTETLPLALHFDRPVYLQQCYTEFNSARYTALAAIGIRLPELPLDSLYVQATAESGEQAGRAAALSRSIEDMLDRIGLKGALRYELERELKRTHGVGGTTETLGARRLYQEHAAICVHGDPGSGKTCFVKSEVLAYCKPPIAEAGWYAKHVPVYVQLSEVARRSDAEAPLLKSIAEVSLIRGLSLEYQDLQLLFSSGEVAFFFDGLDEVVSIEIRARVVDQIAKLIDEGFARGNRFVVTTRPAAAQVVELPSQLRDIHLCGLSAQDQRALARRVLAARVAEDAGELSVEQFALAGKDEAIVDQIVKDLQESSGLRRLATNPLFLTLLVFIYANSGRPSARRHKIYAEAVRTLAIVRSRAAGHHIISEGDLRQRLGSLAIHMFRDRESSILARSEALSVLQASMSSAAGSSVSREDASQFLQDVGESTGLVILSKDESDADSDTITFMHQSFLDYFSAIGLAAGDYVAAIRGGLSDEPRWREILELLSGVINEHSDISPIVEALLQRADPVEHVTLAGLMMAFDCALECDVPPERVQRLLLEATRNAAASLVIRHDPNLREMLAERLGQLSAATVSPIIVQVLASGMRDNDASIAAFFVEALGHVAPQVELTAELLGPFNDACGRREVAVVAAVCGAIVRSTQLRTDEAFSCAASALTGAIPARLAAARAATNSAPIADTLWPHLLKCMRESNGLVASVCAEAILTVGVQSQTLDEDTERILIESLRMMDGDLSQDQQSLRNDGLQRASVDDLLSSPSLQKRVLALRILPLLKNEDVFVAERIRSFLRADSLAHEETVAALSVVARTRSVHRLLKVADVDLVRAMLAANTRDVRIAACRVLATVGRSGASEAAIVDDLLEYASETVKGEEFLVAIWALGRTAPRDPRVSKYLVDALSTSLERRKDDRELVTIMRACQALDGVGPREVNERLRDVVRSYKNAAELRQEALLTVARIEPMTPGLVRFINGFVELPLPELGNSSPRALGIVVERCKRRVEDVRRVFSGLQRSERLLVSGYPKLRIAIISGMGDGAVPAIREAIEEIRAVLVAYREFAQRSSAVDAGLASSH